MLHLNRTHDSFENEIRPTSASQPVSATTFPPKSSKTAVNHLYLLVSDLPARQTELVHFLETSSFCGLFDALNDSEDKAAFASFYFRIPENAANRCKESSHRFFQPSAFKAAARCALLERLQAADFLEHARYLTVLRHFDDFCLHELMSVNGFIENIHRLPLSSLTGSEQSRFLTALLSLLSDRLPLEKRVRFVEHWLSANERMLTYIQTVLKQALYNGTIKMEVFEMAAYAVIPFGQPFLVELVMEAASLWANKTWLRRSPFPAQLFVTAMLAVLFGNMGLNEMNERIESLLLAGIQKRLDHADHQIRLLGMLLADQLAFLRPLPEEKERPDYGLDSSDETVCYIRDRFRSGCKYYYAQATVGPLPEFMTSSAHANRELLPDTVESVPAASDPDDIQPILHLLKENTAKNSKAPALQFLPDFVKALRANETPSTVQTALASLQPVYQGSSALARQIGAPDIFNTLLSLSDKYDLPEFDRLRLDSLASVLSDQLAIVAPLLVESLFETSKLVLNQKMECLRVVADVGRRLYGSVSASQAHPLSTPSRLDLCSKAFMDLEFEERRPIPLASKPSTLQQEFIETLCIPMVRAAVRNRDVFERSHAMFIEKLFRLSAILIVMTANQPSFSGLVTGCLDLFSACTRTKHMQSLPQQKAALLLVLAALEKWPASLSLEANYSRFEHIHRFLVEIGSSDDPELLVLAQSVVASLQDIASPERALTEAAERLELDLREIAPRTTVKLPSS